MKIKANIYKQSFEEEKIRFINPIDMYGAIECEDCQGTGLFHITDKDNQTCNDCKGAGYHYITFY